MSRCLIIGVLLLIHGHAFYAQDSTNTRRIGVLPVPSFGYSPETTTYVGAVALFTIKPKEAGATRTSNVKLKFTYTWRKQIIAESNWNYFFNHERWFTKGQLVYSKYPDLYYGIGPQTPDSNELSFNSNRVVLEGHLYRKIRNKLFVGGWIQHIQYDNVNYNETEKYFPELSSKKISGGGLALLKENRNSLLSASEGHYALLSLGYNLSKNNYMESLVDLRAYKTWRKRFTMAGRFVNYVSPGSLPFFAYPFLGGDRFVRGYYYGRYRNNGLSTIQGEFRFPIVWRIGLACFGGWSVNYSGANQFIASNFKYNVGGGLRILMDKSERTNLRLDYAVGQNGNKGFYVAFGESF